MYPRPPQDVDVLAVLDFQIPCYRPESPTLYLRRSLTKDICEGRERGLRDTGRRGRRLPRNPDREVTDGHSISAREEKMQKVKSELCSTSVCDYFECPTFLKIVLSFPGEVCRQVHRDHYPYRPSISGHCRRHPRKFCY